MFLIHGRNVPTMDLAHVRWNGRKLSVDLGPWDGN